MDYFVTFGGFDHNRMPARAALDLRPPPRGFDLAVCGKSFLGFAESNMVSPNNPEPQE